MNNTELNDKLITWGRKLVEKGYVSISLYHNSEERQEILPYLFWLADSVVFEPMTGRTKFYKEDAE